MSLLGGVAAPAAHAAEATPATPPPAASPAGGVTATLFQWPWNDVAKQCTDVLGPAGYAYVQVSPPQENITGSEWWTSYQTVSYKVGNKLGSQAEFKTMVDTCHKAGVKVMADAVINHMTGRGMDKDRGGKGIQGTPFQWHSYPGIYEADDDFHSCQQDISDYANRDNVQNCDLVGLADLNTGKESVRQRIADYLNHLTDDLGVDALRIDAVKHISTQDMEGIKAKLTNPDIYLQQEVIGAAGEAVSDTEYTGIGKVNEFDYGRHLRQAFANRLADLKHLPSHPDMMPAESAHVFVDNWDTERNSSTMTYKWEKVYTLGNIFMLAHPYGDVNVMSGYRWSDKDLGAPQDDKGMVKTPVCQSDQAGYGDGVFTCTHTWQPVTGMVGFRNAVGEAPLSNWYDDGDRLVAFGRGDRGFIVLNNHGQPVTKELSTGLPDGSYCDVVNGALKDGACTGATIEVKGGKATFTVAAQDAVAIDVAENSLLKAAEATPGETMRVYLEGTSWQSANIHYGIDDKWTDTPGQAMKASACQGGFYADIANKGKDVTGLFNREGKDWYHPSGQNDGNFTWSATARYISVKDGVATASTTSPCQADLADAPATPPDPEPAPDLTGAVTVPGTHNAFMGCERDWQENCAGARLDQQADGTYAHTFENIIKGAYQYKIALDGSWKENYGVDGVADGDNISYTTDGSGPVTIHYDPTTHKSWVEAPGNQPGTGVGERRAYWVDQTTLAWPVSLLPQGVSREQALAAGNAGLSWQLVSSEDASATVSPVGVTGNVTRTDLKVVGELPEAATKARPNLLGYIALSTDSALDRAGVEKALAGQLLVTQTKDGAVQVTGVQTAPVLDSMYAQDLASAPLGVTWDGQRPSFALWAPTAQEATLLTWDTGKASGSAPLVDGEAVRHQAVRGNDGRWVVDNTDATISAGAQYLWEVKVYAPTTGKIETNQVTDPYSVALTLDSKRSVAVDLDNPELAPEQWSRAAAPTVTNDAARSIYELHVRDFSAADTTVPEADRGSYLAFTHSGSNGMKHLATLADAGVNTIHLLPTFDIATIQEDRSKQKTAEVPQAGRASEDQQAAVSAVADEDAYNWGYDPYHYTTPEGSYATTGNQDGGARTYQFRQMVGALHANGMQVVLDQVFNHTAASGQDATSVLDRVVPGYYQRLDANGQVTTSTCCSNTATENAMMERLMIDSVVTWAKHYKVDGFRFDLMGHHSVDTMKRLRTALDALTEEKDGVNGKAIYLYGEGWNFGEVGNNALFTQATQGQLDGTGIGTFNDRMRDGVHGGGPFGPDHRTYQGLGTGQYTAPNGLSDRSPEQELANLRHNTDLVKLGMAGNLKGYALTTADGTVKQGSQIDYNGQPAGYASSPAETVNYVDAHDNETLYDLGVYKLATNTSMPERVRMNTVSLSTVALGQSPAFWAAGTDMLRSKSLDRDSYNSGDYFNAIDWSGKDNGFGKGLPPAGPNSSKWGIMRPLLENPTLKPGQADIAAAKAQALDLMRMRKSTPLFSLGSAELVQAKVSFPGSGPQATPGVINMLIDDPAEAATDVDGDLSGVLVVVNASAEATTQTLPEVKGRRLTLHQVQVSGADEVVKTSAFDSVTGTVTVPARTTAVFVEEQQAQADEPAPLPEGGVPAYVSRVQANGTGTALVGDWDGDGALDWAARVGSRVVFYVENRVDAPVYAAISLGRASDEVLVGDWDGDGKDTLALRRGTRVMTQNTLTSTATTKVKVAGITRSAKVKVKRVPAPEADQVVLAE